MIDTCKPLRQAIFDVISPVAQYNGDAIPIYDEKVFTGAHPNLYILLGKQSERDITEAECQWQTKSTIEIWIIARSGSEVSKDVIDDVAQSFLDALLPGPTVDAILQPQGLAITYLGRESSVSGQVQITNTQSELQKVITLTANILQIN